MLLFALAIVVGTQKYRQKTWMEVNMWMLLSCLWLTVSWR